MSRRRSSNQVAAGIIAGTLMGLFLGLWMRQSVIPCMNASASQDNNPSYPVNNYGGGGSEYLGEEDLQDPGAAQYRNPAPSERIEIGLDNPTSKLGAKDKKLSTLSNTPKKKLLLIGVMTAKKYLNTRIIASYQTWAKTIPGNVIYFSSEGSEEIALPGLPVIGLKGVDDSYPPQKKSFLMLKYMHDIYKDQYEWFMRADDDLYIKGGDLAKFLRSINSSAPHFIGQAGLGNKDEVGQLNLDKNENFCMGGPGMVLSQVVLEKMAPHISYCLKNLYTTHEDVEIGRCIQKFAGTSCTWAFEVSKQIDLIHRLVVCYF